MAEKEEFLMKLDNGYVVFITPVSLLCGMLGKFHQKRVKKTLLIPIVDLRLKPLVGRGSRRGI